MNKARNSNLELYRIIVMVLIIAHHYVVNSGVLSIMKDDPLCAKSLFLYMFGSFGKIGINCFVLITGYFMCKSNITLRKFIRLFLEVLFYGVVIYFLFIFFGYEKFSLKQLIAACAPIYQIQTNFTGCFLIFYLCIPFLNILLKNINERQHLELLLLLSFAYIILGSIPKGWVTMNYVSWFIVLYIIASFIRTYPKKIYENKFLWGG